MLLTHRIKRHKSQWPQRTFQVLGILALCLSKTVGLEVNDPCNNKASPGTCSLAKQCKTIETALRTGQLRSADDIITCGFSAFDEIICCPKLAGESTTSPSVVNPTTTEPRSKERPSIRICREMEARVQLPIENHVLGGVPADPGEFPHMAALGFPVFGQENEYDFSCGGALIAPRFVLTAAHCVNSLEREATIVRLGTNFVKAPDQHTVDIRISRMHIHPNYTNAQKYDDIAVLELADEAPENEVIRPVCLHTEADVIPPNIDHVVSGWGVVHIRNRTVSNILLKASLRVVPLERCNSTFERENAFNRQLPRGLVQSQMCAQDINLKADACQGDSGGPLNVKLNPLNNIYRVVGIVSAGFSCGTQIPGLYTRVISYLDYIESIVWPNA